MRVSVRFPDGFLAELPAFRSFDHGDAFAHHLVAIFLPGGLLPSRYWERTEDEMTAIHIRAEMSAICIAD